MNLVFTSIFTGLISFTATNIDNIFILTALFSQPTSKKRKTSIIAGQYLGMSTLILLSIIGSFGTLLIPKAWMGVLGIVPIYMGVKMLFSNDEANPRSRNALTDLNTYKIMAIMIGNGADNLSVYIPLFMQGSWIAKSMIVTVFFLLTGIWCWLAHRIVHHPWIGGFIEKYGRLVIPSILIALGGYILLEAGTFALLKGMNVSLQSNQ